MTENNNGATSGIPSNLNQLMKWDGNLNQDASIVIERPGGFKMTVVCTSMSDDQQNEYEEQCAEWTSRRGTPTKTVDEIKLIKLYVLNHVADPDLNDPELQGKFNPNNAMRPEIIISKIFLPGELMKIGRLILKLSGFDDLADVDNQIENLIRN